MKPSKVLIIGSSPIIIGQAAEFGYLLSRLLNNRPQPLDQSANEQSLATSKAGDRATSTYAEVVY